jgi:hypothetical protein
MFLTTAKNGIGKIMTFGRVVLALLLFFNWIKDSI